LKDFSQFSFLPIETINYFLLLPPVISKLSSYYLFTSYYTFSFFLEVQIVNYFRINHFLILPFRSYICLIFILIHYFHHPIINQLFHFLDIAPGLGHLPFIITNHPIQNIQFTLFLEILLSFFPRIFFSLSWLETLKIQWTFSRC